MSTTTRTIDLHETPQQRDERLRELLRGCASREENAFTTLYQDTSRILYGSLYRLLKRDELVQECLQDAYLKIWYKAAEYKPKEAAPLTWMSAIARHQAIDMLRRQKREVIEADSKQIAEEVDKEASPEAHVLARSDEAELGFCINQLKSDHRQLFMLAYYKGLSHTELAEQTNLPIGTIKTWMRRGLADLKKCMQPAMISDSAVE
jgi:RNA polymerase sigma-70 factor (ECF subfamily)